eukprot:CAMPEP_0170075184 /NCGR_PEP_ID=MMETSP0019_2-20121128/12357_1 /TAXON_ID=98059 /ORGANISM="Dinobryon sp., Strain UTEXLB2267" /LENGTH=271 /DNA_ID=CAMNT_0010285971 /DNA_START=600 /DNA_END=1415 /DNA_ORIENTATION=+
MKEVVTTTSNIVVKSKSLENVTKWEAQNVVEVAPEIEAQFDAIFEALRLRKKFLLDQLKLIQREKMIKSTATRELIITCQSQSMALQESARLALLQSDLALVANSTSLNKSITTFKENAEKIMSYPSEFFEIPVNFNTSLIQDINNYGTVGKVGIPKLIFITNRHQYEVEYLNGTLHWRLNGSNETFPGCIFELQIAVIDEYSIYSSKHKNQNNAEEYKWTVHYFGHKLSYDFMDKDLEDTSYCARVRSNFNNEWSDYSPILDLKYFVTST